MNDERETPEWLYNELDRIFHFQLDAVASPTNSRGQLRRWMEKCVKETQENPNPTVVALVPADFGVGSGAKTPSVLTVFGPVTFWQLNQLEKFGWVVTPPWRGHAVDFDLEAA
jgi:hypothetical protein